LHKSGNGEKALEDGKDESPGPTRETEGIIERHLSLSTDWPGYSSCGSSELEGHFVHVVDAGIFDH